MPPNSPFNTHRKDLAALATQSRRRALAPRAGRDFASNDYLGLADSDVLRAALTAGIERGLPAGSGGSRLLRGNHAEHEALEVHAARHYGSEAALFFSTGFAANAALFATLPQRGDLVVHDELIHASAHDGMRLGRAGHVAAAHNDAQAFEDIIVRWRAGGGAGTPWIAVESLYSMDGDRAPLAQLAEVADRHDAIFIVDEAHATGVFGPGGAGLSHGLTRRDNLVTLHTCGKALGAEGALLCAPAIVRDFLVNRARPFIFSTAPSPLMAWLVRQAIEIVANEPERQARLHALVRHAAERLVPLGIPASGTQILPVIIGDNDRAMRIARRLQAAGFDIRGIRPPTVAEGTARLRIAITLNIDESDIDDMADALADAMAAA
ncbi:8-amino-7-oxononanoate synthase [Sphingopyxis alaskensis]|jgi:8-amino-7-oxononanoate synthase|uniref:8-amino-7-oxononanoate synthase n=1 Tax=Sphingopyxis alaskensis (strain DSM 13593 / LMG 18877 / RB2256) TaxID=317655 RepID=Q1GT36_SPHAL|nr:8-amino-7-oxononanoate synthase [Sphingopyxis alaskensis]ABF53186.1 8-amino-7-oxononanoate synthase [Sphingopyxis alaskensis RB2256]MCM3418605.1 8-amino-7-oxononanoate synthase [Sphingopyxis alaskensis]